MCARVASPTHGHARRSACVPSAHDCAPRTKATRLAPGARFCDFFVSAALTIAGPARSLMAAMMLLWVVVAVAVRRWQSLLAVAVGRRVCLHARWGVKPREPCQGRP